MALNPVRVSNGRKSGASSNNEAHLAERDSGFVSVAPLLDRCAARFVDPVDLRFLLLGVLGSRSSGLRPLPPKSGLAPSLNLVNDNVLYVALSVSPKPIPSGSRQCGFMDQVPPSGRAAEEPGDGLSLRTARCGKTPSQHLRAQ
jgi:hypothetical protein